MIQIKDNFLPREQYEQIKTVLTAVNFPWFYWDFKVEASEEGDFYQFEHTFYENFQPTGNIIVLEPIISKLGVNALRRVKANMLMRNSEIKTTQMHRDYKGGFENSKTSIYYINTNNGKTIFEDGTEVESVANRLVTFPTEMLHAGTTHTDEKYRMLVNFNWY